MMHDAQTETAQHENVRYNWPDSIETERPEMYTSGGLHPVHIGDCIGAKERFEVFYKLGYGDYSTVWLCFDNEKSYWMAVKIIAASESCESHPELTVMRIFEGIPRDELVDNHILLPSEHFWIDGPNGRHLCLVSELISTIGHGPPIGMGQHEPDGLNDLCFQICSGVRYLHNNGVCHGDIRHENIGMELIMDGVTLKQIDKYIEGQEVWSIKDVLGKDLGPAGPEYLVVPAMMRKLERRFGSGRAMILDFGLSYRAASEPKGQQFYRATAAPELMFQNIHRGFPTDVWALACTICGIIKGKWIFDEFSSYPEHIQTMEVWFGPFPRMYKRGIDELLDIYSDKVRSRKKPSAIEDQASTTRSGRNYQAYGPLTLEYSREGYLAYLKWREQRSGWAIPMQGFLSYRQQSYRYWETLDTIAELSSDEDSDSSEQSNLLSPKDRNAEAEPPTIENPPSPLSEPITQQPRPIRLIDSEFGKWPSPENPCSCYFKDENGEVQKRPDLCNAKDHFIGHPLMTTMWALTKEEVLSLSDLLLKMLRYDPAERISVEEVMNHAWFSVVKQHYDQVDATSDSDEIA
ncbi:kinase-like domain-containing protein [Whalleya microplaca]|nr:kinase-like domain-containing protein [Whalleya microplaca]